MRSGLETFENPNHGQIILRISHFNSKCYPPDPLRQSERKPVEKPVGLAKF